MCMRKSIINWYMYMKCDHKIQASVIAIHSKVFMFLWQETFKFFWSCYFEVKKIFLDSEVTQQCYRIVEIKLPYSAILWLFPSSPTSSTFPRSGEHCSILSFYEIDILTSTRERSHMAFVTAWYILPKIMTSPLTLISPNKIC
jgi:hypothetical protein